jgi:hypothetical protein
LAALVVVALVQQRVVPLGNGGSNNSKGDLRALQDVRAIDFDPYGDDEHPEVTHLSTDGNTSTEWTTQSYSSSLSAQNKPGVGLVFDLGDSIPVERVQVWATTGLDYELRVTDSLGSINDEKDFQLVDGREDAPARASFDVSGESGRFWLFWITDLPGGGGGSAQVAEVRFFVER